ncbi:hypothetical protein [Methanosarcina siciliae]|uniref:hypothetical protein n=1 Tax=Methanosarcina siciliae TaxID=38027 RepID=UPI000ADB9346|nr:hypothetical protein [Methanosarcina siciliae]
MSKDFTCIKFPAGTNKVYLDDVCYELDRDTDSLTISFEGYFSSFPERLAPCLINIFGLGGVEALKILTMFVSILLFFIFILKMILEVNVFFSLNILFFASMVFFLISSYISKIKNYYNVSKCNKCGKDFAYNPNLTEAHIL